MASETKQVVSKERQLEQSVNTLCGCLGRVLNDWRYCAPEVIEMERRGILKIVREAQELVDRDDD